MLAVFHNPTFRRLWLGTLSSGVATWALPFLLGLFVIDGQLTPSQLGIILATRTIGFLMILPLAGSLSDLWSPTRVIQIAGLCAALGSLMVTMPYVSLIAAFLIGIGQGACRPAFQTLIAINVEPNQRQAAHAANTLAQRLVIVLAPALAVTASQLISTQALIMLTAVLWLLAMWSPCGKSPVNSSSKLIDALRQTASSLSEGIREARRHRWFLAGLGVLVTVIMLGYSATGVLLPLTATEVAGSAEDANRLLAAATTSFAIGAIGGAVLVSRWVPKSQGWWALAGLGAYGLVAAAMAFTLTGTSWLIVIAAYVIAGIGIELFNVPWFTAIQREIPPQLIARVSSIDFIVSYGLAPIGLAIIAPVTNLLGLGMMLWLVASACILAAVGAAFVPGSRDFHEPNGPTVEQT